MVTAINRETESNTAVAEPQAAAPAAAAVDVSAIPETPAELLKQWDAPEQRSLLSAIPAAFAGLWDAVTGPGMTEQDRLRRNIAEHNGYARVRGPHV